MIKNIKNLTSDDEIQKITTNTLKTIKSYSKVKIA